MTPDRTHLRTALILAAFFAAAASSTWADDPVAATPAVPPLLAAPATPAAQNPPAAQPTSQAAQAAPATQRLDLRAPDVRTVVPVSEWSTPLVMPEDDPNNAPETVDVNSESQAPDIPSGLASLWWSVVHPLSAWRIFTPVE